MTTTKTDRLVAKGLDLNMGQIEQITFVLAADANLDWVHQVVRVFGFNLKLERTKGGLFRSAKVVVRLEADRYWDDEQQFWLQGMARHEGWL